MSLPDILNQIFHAALYYLGLILLVRLAGKRLAGQTTTFDLLILISLGVTLQNVTLGEGKASAATFILTVFILHRLTALGCAHSPFLCRLVRGGPRPLVRNGRIIKEALLSEALTKNDLEAALRKLGFESVEDVKIAVLEETGHISAIRKDS
ncbi:MAG: DUF421 domain-containing protein [Proteobacteria bacterium]|nr:MAG: DUF421 domain-containing protein [Pseudomonadota bacterium]